MAMIDYGAVVFKNGVKMNDDLFMDMLESVGWVDYPKNRYPDCDCLDEDGYANCCECPRSQRKHYSRPDLGEWDAVIADCKGNELHIEGKLDGNYFAYIGDEELTFCFYKRYVTVASNRKKILDLSGADTDSKDRGHMSFRGNVSGVGYHVRNVGGNVWHFSMRYKGDNYHVVYGYGIEPNDRIWNKIKVRYLGKKLSSKVDKLYKRIAG